MRSPQQLKNIFSNTTSHVFHQILQTPDSDSDTLALKKETPHTEGINITAIPHFENFFTTTPQQIFFNIVTLQSPMPPHYEYF